MQGTTFDFINLLASLIAIAGLFSAVYQKSRRTKNYTHYLRFLLFLGLCSGSVVAGRLTALLHQSGILSDSFAVFVVVILTFGTFLAIILTLLEDTGVQGDLGEAYVGSGALVICFLFSLAHLLRFNIDSYAMNIEFYYFSTLFESVFMAIFCIAVAGGIGFFLELGRVKETGEPVGDKGNDPAVGKDQNTKSSTRAPRKEKESVDANS